MASSDHFPSGLNNWAGSDKPTRLDFVGDNAVLDENAMWKATYDSDGQIAEAGGISAWALPQASYDPDGVVADAGGISVFVQQNAYAYTQNYTRASAAINADTGALEITSILQHSEDYYTVQFISPIEYSPELLVAIDGTEVVLTDVSGEALPAGAWGQGVPVSLMRKGEQAFFSVGGGASTKLNYRVITVASQQELPQNPVENTFAVVTSGAFSRYAVSQSVPAWLTLQDGDMWIQTDYNSPYSVSALKGRDIMMFYPTGVAQYNATNGTWGRKDSYLYQNGVWKIIYGGLVYDAGTQYVPLERALFTNNLPATVTFNPTNIAISMSQGTSGQMAMGGVVTARMFDLTNFTTLRFNVSDPYWVPFCFMVISQSKNFSNPLILRIAIAGSGENALDVSGLSGEYYLGYFVQANDGVTGGRSTITKIWLT